MKKLFLFCILFLASVSAQAAQTPSQVLSSAAAWQQLSDRDLRIASSYLLLQLAGLSTTPTATMSNAASWQALSDHDLLIAQAYLLTQVTSGGATNLTPWTTDINAAGFSLTNVGSIVATNGLTVTGGSNTVGQTIFTNAVYYGTNLDNGVAIDVTVPVQWFNTNNNVNLTLALGAAQYTFHTFITYSNYKNGNITLAGPPNVRYIGTASTNSMVLPSAKQGVWEFWGKVNLITNGANASEP